MADAQLIAGPFSSGYLPSIARNDMPNRGPSNPKLIPEFLGGYLAFSVNQADGGHACPRQLGAALLFTASRPPLLRSITAVVLTRAFKQVSAIAAELEIAGMASQQRMRVLAVVQEVGDAVGLYVPVLNPNFAVAELPVSRITRWRHPKPAVSVGPVSRRFIDLGPETGDIFRRQRQKCFTRLRHRISSADLVYGGRVLNAPVCALLFYPNNSKGSA